MRKPVLLLLFFLPLKLMAQEVKTIVPAAPVVIGSAFQVQFVMTDAPEKISHTPAHFDSFQLVSGPHFYEGKTVAGNGVTKKIKNIAYTLVPLSVGRQKIRGITVQSDEGSIRSNDVSITVVAQPRASFNVQSSYTDVSLYSPSSRKDLDRLIDGNLFLKTEVDKRQCLQGEPVVATFKLYSRLQSSSEVVKSPAFYGFTAVDMLDINKPHPSVETVGDKVFNVSILRKVQLYPVQSGKQMIDVMNVNSEIEFRDSANPERKILLQKELNSLPVVIDVKPLPAGKPEQFAGAVGQFFMETTLGKHQLSMNEEGKLFVTIRGRGDFLQVSGPAIQWPSHIDAFELPLQEQIRKEVVPLSGQRTYSYSFTAGRAGEYVIPPIEFSFFDPATSQYQRALSDSIRFSVHQLPPAYSIGSRTTTGQRFPYLLAIILGGMAVILYLFRKNKASNRSTQAPVKEPSPSEQLKSLSLDSLSEKDTCLAIRRILFDVLRFRHGIGSLLEAAAVLKTEDFHELQAILQECEMISYSSLEESALKETLRNRAVDWLLKWERG